MNLIGAREKVDAYNEESRGSRLVEIFVVGQLMHSFEFQLGAERKRPGHEENPQALNKAYLLNPVGLFGKRAAW